MIFIVNSYIHKYMKIFITIIISIIFLAACAKPHVTEKKLSGDENLNCEELELAVFEAEKFKRDGEFAKTGTGGNMTRMLMFWPAWAKTFHNADKAIIAAENRIYHLSVLMKQKKCNKTIELSSNQKTVPDNIPSQLKELKQLYDSGLINKDEYKMGKKKILK